MNVQRPRSQAGWMAVSSLGVVLAVAVLGTAAASARTAAVPQNTAPPTITGTMSEGNTLTASNGSWSNSPTSFAYQWRQCDSSGSSCSDIAGATKQTYTLTSSDVDHTSRVVVTASNADGQSAASSAQTQLISSSSAPVNTVKPMISGTDKVGQQLSTTTGTWTGGVSSYSYQWQHCGASGANCVDVVGATGSSYGVRATDASNTVRVEVTAKNASDTATVASDTSSVIAAVGSTVIVNKAPSLRRPALSFRSFKLVGARAYARFKVCTHNGQPVTVIERDARFGVLSFARRFAVRPVTCATFSRSWVPAARFRAPGGRLTALLRAVERDGLSSRLLSRSVHIPSL